jgi:succinyl-CoA synthetase beta subunit
MVYQSLADPRWARLAQKFSHGASMNVHEYQAKQLLKGFGVPVALGNPAFTAEEAVKAAQGLPGPVYVVKSQIHAGGRGKGKFKEAAAGDKGGVRIVKPPTRSRLLPSRCWARPW